MSLNLNFNFGRLLGITERLTTARVNAIVRGISASITGTVGKSDLSPGAVDETIAAPGPYFYTDNCTLIGTTYTVTGFPVEPTALVDGMILYFKADAVNTGATTLAVGALGTHTITKYGGQPLVAGDILAEQIVGVQYNTTLLAQPTWQFIGLPGNQFLPTSAPVQGSARGLLVMNNVASPTTKVDVTASEVLLKSAAGDPYLAGAVNVTANVAASGANGLDTGAVAANTWYYVWVIYNPSTTTVAALLSTSATAPTMPAGYTFKALVGTVHAGIVGGSTTDFMTFYQQDQDVWILETDVFTGKTGVTSWTAVSGADLTLLQKLIPPNAKQASGFAGEASNNGGIAIGADANGLGAQVASKGQNAAGAVLGLNIGGAWRAPLKTAQTLYYIMGDTSNGYQLTVSGYRL